MKAIYVTYLIEEHIINGELKSVGTVTNCEVKTMGIAPAVADYPRAWYESVVRYSLTDNSISITRFIGGKVNEQRQYIKGNSVVVNEDVENSIKTVMRIENE